METEIDRRENELMAIEGDIEEGGKWDPEYVHSLRLELSDLICSYWHSNPS